MASPTDHAVDLDCLVVGAGVVGLACARALALQGRDVVVVERERAIGQGVSSRNSEVVHAGIYYPRGSLKAQLCVEGRQALYEYCESRGVPYRRCGKLIVAASDDQRERLLAIADHARANGVDDIALIERGAIAMLEPDLRAVLALHSPSTGIVDTHALMLSLAGELSAAGGAVALATRLVSARRVAAGWAVTLADADGGSELVARHVVVAAGLFAPFVARAFEGIDKSALPQAHFAKGSYFSLARRAPFSRLVYPMPEPGGLGVHLTLDLAGRARFGPDVEWLPEATAPDAIDYAVDPRRADGFYAAIRRYWPGLRDGELTPDYAGVRPKIVARGAPDADFMLLDGARVGAPGLIALMGIESPGLTSALALAARVTQMIEGNDRTGGGQP